MRQARPFLVAFLLVFSVALDAAAQRRVYTIGTGTAFPPWDVGPRRGVNYDLLTAICAANSAMRCRIQVRPNADCVASDDAGNLVIGAGLASGSLDACIGWFNTAEREQLGAEFAHPHSFGPTPQLIAADGGGFGRLEDGASLGGALVGFIAGFFTDPSCLGRHHDDFESQIFEASDAGRTAMVAALLDGSVDLLFWDSVQTVPAGTHVVGVPIQDCGPLLSTILFPPNTGGRRKADDLRRDFNCGLALIRANGVMAEICARSKYPGGDPQCILEGPPPTVQCLADNPAL
jgi:ABC-type amino acid transport substrate-binding protein